MEGDLVLVRAMGDEPCLVRVWRDDGAVVLVCGASREADEAIRAGDAIPVGFRRADVFRYQEGHDVPEEPDWDTMVQY